MPAACHHGEASLTHHFLRVPVGASSAGWCSEDFVVVLSGDHVPNVTHRALYSEQITQLNNNLLMSIIIIMILSNFME